MNRIFIVCASAVLLVGAIGCQTTRPNAAAGGLLGGTAGGLVGAAIGSHEGKTEEGALIGALAGGLTGAAIGHQADEANLRRQRIENENAIRTRRAAVTINDVIQMTQSGLGEDLIINQIKSSGIANRPTTNDLIQLKSNGVTDLVIQEFQSAAPRIASTHVQPNYYPTNPAIYVEPHYAPICHAPHIIYRRTPKRVAPRHAHHARSGFTFRF